MLTQSYVHGASEKPLLGEAIGAHFDRIVASHAESPALVVRHQGVRWSWGELKDKVDALAAGLVALGLAPGERIGIWSSCLLPSRRATIWGSCVRSPPSSIAASPALCRPNGCPHCAR